MATPLLDSVDLDAFFGRFSRETDRACAVLGAAYLDALLEDLLKQRLTQLQDRLLSHQGPLGTFGSRVAFAYSLCWIDADTHADLDMIRSIRNGFAHSFDHELSFADQSIADRCKNLRSSSAFLDGFSECAKHNRNFSKAAIDSMRDAVSTPRWRFQIAVEAIAQLLHGLPHSVGVGYCGPNLLKEAYSMSARLRLTIRGTGVAPQPRAVSQEDKPAS